MKPINFKEKDTIFAENQPEYIPLPAFVGDRFSNPQGNVVFCMSLLLKKE